MTGFLDSRLYFQRWTPKGAALENLQGHLVITHGQGEHSDCYARVIQALANENWLITAWDWRGHGRSEGLRGYARQFNDYCNDFEIFMESQVFSRKGPFPLVLLSHSMGGLIQLKTLANHPDWPVRAQILSNPLLGVAVHVPEYKQKIARWSVEFLPKMTLFNEIKESDLTRDAEVLAEFARDNLRHNRISAGVYLGSLEAAEWMYKAAPKITQQTLMQISAQDPIVSSNANREFFQIIRCEKTLIEYEGFKHEIYNDVGREIPLRDLVNFLRSLHNL